MYSPMELTLTGLTLPVNHRVLAIASGQLAPPQGRPPGAWPEAQDRADVPDRPAAPQNRDAGDPVQGGGGPGPGTRAERTQERNGQRGQGAGRAILDLDNTGVPVGQGKRDDSLRARLQQQPR